jgi:hypothetical protein
MHRKLPSTLSDLQAIDPAASDLRGKVGAHRSGDKIMTRLLFAAALVVAGLSGCASPARYIDRTPDGGIVAIPANTDYFPTYNRSAAIEKIKEHVGPNYEIVEERETPKGQQTFSNQQVNNKGQSITNTTTTQDLTEWQITYRRKSGVMGMPMSPLPGQFGGVQQTQYLPGSPATGVKQAGGVVPSAAPVGGVYPAGGMMGGPPYATK